MAETSFTDIEAAATEAAADPTYNPIGNTDPAPGTLTRVEGTVAPASSPVDLSGTGVEGEIRRQDVNIPKITVVNGLSKARTEGDLPLGAVIYADSVVLGAPKKGEVLGPKITVYVLNIKKGYQKHVPFGSEEKIVRADTAAEVRELGGTLDRRDKSRVFFEETAQILLMIPAPENLEESDLAYFRHELNGVRYATALFFVKSIAYTNVAKPIFTRVNNTGEATFEVAYELQTSFQKTEKFSWWTPKLKVLRTSTPEEKAFLLSKRA